MGISNHHKVHNMGSRNLSINRVKQVSKRHLLLVVILLLFTGGSDVEASIPLFNQQVSQEMAFSNLSVSYRDDEALRVSIDVNEMHLLDLLHELAREVRVEISIQSENISNTKVSYTATHETIYTILDELLVEHDLEYSLHNDRKLLIIRNQLDEEEEVFQQTVTGQVTDAATGETLPGVNIAVEGTNRGTVTDNDGEYNIQIEDTETVLNFSFIGYATQSITVGDSQTINVALEQDLGRLDEVIVVGYGTVQKSDLTGSVERVTADQFSTQNMAQITDMLTGTVAGFYAQQGTSAAGGGSMEIRGATSLLASTEPLIVLDGVIYNGSLRDINPHDVETIDILKDASSAAVYGAKSASGVVLITTTRGSTGRPVISFNSETGLTQAASHHRPLGPEEFLKFRGDYLRTIRGFDQTPVHYYTHPDDLPADINLDEWSNYSDSPHEDHVREYLNRHLLTATEREQYMAGQPADWYDMVMDNGIRRNYNVSIAVRK